MTASLNKISILGAGAWGTALAQVLSGAGRHVVLYARSRHLAEAIAHKQENLLYLPDVRLNAGIRATHDPEEAVRGAQIVLLAVPAQHLRGTLQLFRPFLPEKVPLISCAKGIEIDSGKLLSEVATDEAPGHPYGVLSGPTFAHEVAAGLPAAATLATADSGGAAWAEALRAGALRPYLSTDVAGAEISGAVKNVIAIACGIVDGRRMGQNARAAVMTRGMAEIRRFGASRGALPETFLGLSGIGDLTLTCNSLSSRNFSLGHALGAGRPLAEVLASRTSVAEGVATARAMAKLSEKDNLDMPICRAVDHILYGGGEIGEIISGLLSRALKNEGA